MKSIFTALTRASLRFRGITILLAIIISITGIIAITQLKQELIPSVEFPQTIILAQVSGMTGDQVLNVVTKPIEASLKDIPEIVNLESTTTGSFGAVITARNDFGLNQERLRDQIRTALDTLPLPMRRIQPPSGESASAFATRLLGDLTPDDVLWLASNDSTFLFELTPEVWSAFSPETTRAALAYLAQHTQSRGSAESALRSLVENELVPLLDNIPQVASVQVAGGQILPDENGAIATPIPQTTTTNEASLLLQLTPEIWSIASAKVDGLGALDDSAVTTLSADPVTVPASAPALPESWHIDHFKDARDLREMVTLTRSVGDVFNSFADTGVIVGALGQTDDLTADVVNQMLSVDPTLVNAFDADQLAAMPADAFAALPADYLASLDGFTRDALAAKALAQSITGSAAELPPVDLPNSWRIQPPQILLFSLDDIPLATFSIAGSGLNEAAAPAPAADTTAADTNAAAIEATPAPTEAAQTATETIPEGPALPPLFSLLGTFMGIPLDTADDLINLHLPENLAQQLGNDTISAGQLLNFLMLLSDPSTLPPGTPSIPIPGGTATIVRQMSPEAITFLADHDPKFLSELSSQVYGALSDDVLKLPIISPPLDQVWNTLASQPQFTDHPLQTLRDVITLGDGSAATFLNEVNANVPEQFAGYDVRLFNSLTPGMLRFFVDNEPDFYSKLDSTVLVKFSPDALKSVPAEVISALPVDTAAMVNAIAAGEQPSASEALASLYQQNVLPADPNAPALNSDWAVVANFMGFELDSADDFSRFVPNTAEFINSFFNSAQGAAFAPSLIGGLSPEAVQYMVSKEPDLLQNLRIEALQLFSPEVVATFPADVQERIASGAVPFTPTDTVTRLNGNASLNVTVFKTKASNNVEAFHTVYDALKAAIADHPGVTIGVGFEQASFVEESINGVAREGGLGAIFAIVVILVFLSSGAWSRGPRAIVGVVLTALFLVILAVLTFQKAGETGSDLSAAFNQLDVVVRVLLMGGAITGLVVLLYPGKLPYPSWRSTLVTAISIPLSVLMAMTFMHWIPPAVHGALAGAADSGGIVGFLLRLFPESITLNIMTLSGLTVAIGRVVDDSIVVLENIFRQIQQGGDKRTAIVTGVRDVSVAIFAATVITVVVFLPLGLTGGIIGEFFLPFGLAVTYALASSFIVAITVVPVAAWFLLDPREIGHDEHGVPEKVYLPVLRWVLQNRVNGAIVLVLAFVSLILSGALFGTRPLAFLPSFGEPQITVSVTMPTGTKIVDTNAKVEEFERYIHDTYGEDQIDSVSTTIGGGSGLAALILGSTGVSENEAQVNLGVASQDTLDKLTGEIRTGAVGIFGEDNVTVSGQSLSEQGFGGFALVLTGPQAELEAINGEVIDTLNHVEGLANASSNLSQAASGGADANSSYIRIDGQSALQFSAEVESENSLGVTANAIKAVKALPDLPADVTVSEGFQSRQQTEGFAGLFTAMGIAIVIVIIVLVITFGSVVHWLDIILSIAVAPVGAAILLTLTDRTLGISAMIGMLMLIGIVVTNAVVLIDRVKANQRERHMSTHDALYEAGGRRLRPILMTALATIFALVPLAIGLSEGAIIASELGTVVIGGLFSSTLLTLIVVPVAYNMLDPLHKLLTGQSRVKAVQPAPQTGD